MWRQRISSRYLKGHLPCLTPYNRKQNVLSVSLNKTFPSFLLMYKKSFFKKKMYSSQIFKIKNKLLTEG